MSSITQNGRNKPTEAAIDELVVSQADDDSVWEKSFVVKHAPQSESSSLTKEKILALLEKHAERIHAFGIIKLGLFGSFVRKEQHGDSDVDFLVEFEKDKKSFDNFIQLAFFLEDLLAKRVELLTPEGLSPHIRPAIMKEVEYAALTA